MEDVNISKYRAQVVRAGSTPASPGFVVSEGQDPVNPSGSSNYVPYSGAISNVDLGEFGLDTGFVTLDTTPTNIPTEQGGIYWDDSRSTAALIMNGTLQHIGQDTFFYVKNSTGSSIPKGTAVRFNGTDGASGHLLIAPFLANGTYPSNYFMGVTAEAIANGSFGQVMHFGELSGVNTSGYTAGALLYASTSVAGTFQTTAPVAPNNIVLVAAAINSTNNGTILVRPTYGSNINQDEGVKITSGTTGDLLQLQAGGLWENKTLAQVIGSAYVPSTRTITINGTTQDLSANRTYNVGTVTAVTASSPLFSSGGATPNITIQQASGSQNGFLSSTDWTTFNNKQNALTNPVTGTGTTNYLPKFTGASTIGNSNLIDSGSLVTINSETKLLVGANATRNLFFGTSATNYGRITYNDATGELAIGTMENYSLLFATQNTTKMTLTSGGNLLIGTTTDAGYKLDVNGTGRFSQSTNGEHALTNTNSNSGSDAASLINLSNNASVAQFVYTSSTYAGAYDFGTNSLAIINRASGSINFVTAGFNSSALRMRITSAGQLLVGTSSTDLGISVDFQNLSSASSNVLVRAKNTTLNEDCGFVISANSSGTQRDYIIGIQTIVNSPDLTFSGPTGFQWYVGGTERMRITSGGYLKASNDGSYLGSNIHEFLANTSNSYTLIVSNKAASPASTYIQDFRFTASTPNNSSARFWNCEDATSVRAYMRSNGGLSNYQANDTNLSDERTKKDIEPLESYWDKFKNIEIVKFKYKDQTHNDFNIGVIAQQVEKVAPEFVDVDGWSNETESNKTVTEDEPMKSIYTADLHHATIKVLQEAMEKIEAMQKEIDTLKN